MSARNTDEIESKIEFERLFVDDLLNRLTRIENAWRLRIEDVLFGGDGSCLLIRDFKIDCFAEVVSSSNGECGSRHMG